MHLPAFGGGSRPLGLTVGDILLFYIYLTRISFV